MRSLGSAEFPLRHARTGRGRVQAIVATDRVGRIEAEAVIARIDAGESSTVPVADGPVSDRAVTYGPPVLSAVAAHLVEADELVEAPAISSLDRDQVVHLDHERVEGGIND